jgi:hypothetical protein
VEVECSLVEAARAACQFECRTITVIRHTETRLHMFDRTTICDIRGSGPTGKAVDQKVLSAEILMSEIDDHRKENIRTFQ